MARGVIRDTHSPPPQNTHTHFKKSVSSLAHQHLDWPHFSCSPSLSPHTQPLSFLARQGVKVQLGNGVTPTWQCQVIQGREEEEGGGKRAGENGAEF